MRKITPFDILRRHTQINLKIVKKTIAEGLALGMTLSPLSSFAYDDDYNTYKPQSYRNEYKPRDNYSPSAQLDRQVKNLNSALQFRLTANYASVTTPKITAPVTPLYQPKIEFKFVQPQEKLDAKAPTAVAEPVKTGVFQAVMKTLTGGLQKIGGAITNTFKQVFGGSRRQEAIQQAHKAIISQYPNLAPTGKDTYQSNGQTFAFGKMWEPGATFKADNQGQLKLIEGTSYESSFGGMRDKNGGLLPVKMADVNGTVTPVSLDFGRLKVNTVIKVEHPTLVEGFGTIQPGEMTYQGPIKSPTTNDVVGGRFNFSNTKVDLNPAMSKSLGMDNPASLRQATFALQAGLMKLQAFAIERGNKTLVVTENNNPQEKAVLKAQVEKLTVDLEGLSDRSQRAAEKGTQAFNYLSNALGTGLMNAPVQKSDELAKDLLNLKAAVQREEFDSVAGKVSDLNAKFPAIEQAVTQKEATANTLESLAENYRIAVSQETNKVGKAEAIVNAGKALEELSRTNALPPQTIQVWRDKMGKDFDRALLGKDNHGAKGLIGGLVSGLIKAVTWPLQIIGGIMDRLLPKIAKALDNTWLGQKLGTGALFGVLSGDIFRAKTQIEFSEKGPAVISINGVFNNRRKAIIIKDFVMSAFGVEKSTRIENGTTYVGDILQFFGHEYLGTVDRPALDTAKAIRAGIAAKGEVYVVAHSQGSAIFNAALNLLSKEEKSKIHYLGVGAEWFISAEANGLASAENVWNKADVIPRINQRLTAWLVPSLVDRKLHAEWKKIDSPLNSTFKGNHHSFIYYHEAVFDWAKRMNQGK